MSESPPPPPSWNLGAICHGAVQFLRLPVLASSGLAVVASSLLYFKQKFVSSSSRPDKSQIIRDTPQVKAQFQRVKD